MCIANSCLRGKCLNHYIREPSDREQFPLGHLYFVILKILYSVHECLQRYQIYSVYSYKIMNIRLNLNLPNLPNLSYIQKNNLKFTPFLNCLI